MRDSIVLTIGHRGCAGQYPENTIEAVRACAPHVDMIEIDVLRCGSGELIAFHDDSLERVTGVDATVADTGWEWIRSLAVFDSDARIPQVKELLEEWPDGTGLNLDIHEPGIAPDALAMAEERVDDILLSSTSTTVLRECETTPVEIQTGYSFHQDSERNIAQALSLGCDFIHVPYKLCLETDLVVTAHEADLLVDAWTVTSGEIVTSLREVGVDAVTVDRWDIF